MGIGTDFPLYNPATWYAPTTQVTSKGLQAGRVFIDNKGYRWQLHKLNTALAASATVAGTTMYYKDPENWTVTDDRSDAFEVASTPIFAGVITGAFAVSGATTSTDKWVLLLIEGIYNTLKTDGGDDIVEGDILICHATNDGGVDRLSLAAGSVTDPANAPPDADALRDDLVVNTIPSIESLFVRLQYASVGWALDDDVDANNTVKAYIKKKL